MKALLEAIAKGLVDEPQRVRVHEWTEDGMVHYDLEVSDRDKGRVIGRQGRTADAIRTVVEAAGRQKGVDCDVEILD